MPFLFNAKNVIPAPFVQIAKSFQTTDDGRIVGTSFLLNIKGKLTVDKGSPNSSGSFSASPGDENIVADAKLASIFRKQEALRGLFSAQNDGKKLEFTPWDGSGSVWCNPRLKQVDFGEGNWVNLCDYTIQMETDVLYEDGGSGIEDTGDPLIYKVSKANEEWNIEAGDELARTYRLTHSLSAQGKHFYSSSGTIDKQAWENAKDYVLNKIGLGLNSARMVATGVLNAGSLVAYNYMRSQHINELGGGFNVTETWLCFNPGSGAPAKEDFTVNMRTAENGITHVSCEGTITGYLVSNNTTFVGVTDRYTNALAKWGEVAPYIFTRCQTVSGLTLNPVPLGLNQGHNLYNGVITFTQEFDNRAIPTIIGAVSETITLQDHNPADVFASVPVLGRALGPVLQDISTVTARKRSVQMEIIMPAARIGFSATRPSTGALLATLLPIGYSVILKDDDQESWSERTGHYSRSTSFTWEA